MAPSFRCTPLAFEPCMFHMSCLQSICFLSSYLCRACIGARVCAHVTDLIADGTVQPAQDGIPRQLTLVGQKPREAMERLSLMQFARVRLHETAAQPAEEALGRLPVAKTRVWKPVHDRALLRVRR